MPPGKRGTVLCAAALGYCAAWAPGAFVPVATTQLSSSFGSGRMLSGREGAPAGVDSLSACLPAAAAAVGVGCLLRGLRPSKPGRDLLARRADAGRVPPEKVLIKPDADAVGMALCQEVASAAAKAIAERGAFALAIPGGSILKMLKAGKDLLKGVEWSKGIMAYVNHKCVPNDSPDATHKKALDLFLSDWNGLKVVTLGGSDNGPKEADRYEAELKAFGPNVLPRNPQGLPVFDISLVGVGDDGHFGSLYPGRKEILDQSGKWVLPVDKKSPPSITLTPAVVQASKVILIASAGVSEKYPLGKSEAMKRAIEAKESPESFPASVLRGSATWLLDEAAASALSEEYRKK